MITTFALQLFGLVFLFSVSKRRTSLRRLQVLTLICLMSPHLFQHGVPWSNIRRENILTLSFANVFVLFWLQA